MQLAIESPWLALDGRSVTSFAQTGYKRKPLVGAPLLALHAVFTLDEHLLVVNPDNVNYLICGLARGTYLHRMAESTIGSSTY